MREKRRLSVFENRVLRRIFGPKRDKVTREWRKLHNEELSDLYSSPNIVRVTKSMVGTCSSYGGEKRRIQCFGGKNLRERYHLGDQGVDGRIIIRWIFRKWGVVGVDWIELTQDRDRWRALVNAVMNLRVP
jgi:hypothetical protein